uniref:Lipoprotein n=1 Tax=Steinernema glaseri TaxID=37863 RepID=A0A1I7Z8E2_9BILA
MVHVRRINDCKSTFIVQGQNKDKRRVPCCDNWDRTITGAIYQPIAVAAGEAGTLVKAGALDGRAHAFARLAGSDVPSAVAIYGTRVSGPACQVVAP